MNPILAPSTLSQEHRAADWWPRRGLYVLTPDEPDSACLMGSVLAAISGGACMVQYRSKRADMALQIEQAALLMRELGALGIPLIVNDDVELAHAVGADGVHLGAHDGEPKEARARLGPRAIIGVSCYDDLRRAEAAVAAGASYVAFGSFHDSSTKPGAPRARLRTLRDAARFGLPRVAIGGILPENAAPLLSAGADLLAVSGGVFGNKDPFTAAARFRPLFEN